MQWHPQRDSDLGLDTDGVEISERESSRGEFLPTIPKGAPSSGDKIDLARIRTAYESSDPRFYPSGTNADLHADDEELVDASQADSSSSRMETAADMEWANQGRAVRRQSPSSTLNPNITAASSSRAGANPASASSSIPMRQMSSGHYTSSQQEPHWEPPERERTCRSTQATTQDRDDCLLPPDGWCYFQYAGSILPLHVRPS